MIDYSLHTDTDLAVLMLQNRDNIEAAKNTLTPGVAKTEYLAKLRAERQNIAQEQKSRLQWTDLSIPTLIIWSGIVVKEARSAEGLSNKAA